jgi:hypothetical protein
MASCPSSLRVVAAVVALLLACKAQAETAEFAAGMQRITMETREEAIRCGHAGSACAVEPYRLCPARNSPFQARLATPFSRVAAYVFEVAANGDRLKPMTPGAANGWGVGIYVFPSDDPTRADAIRHVWLRREGQTIEPLTVTLAPVSPTDRAVPAKPLVKGFFSFPMEAFAPTADVTIVMAGSTEEVSCTLDRRKLSTLR